MLKTIRTSFIGAVATLALSAHAYDVAGVEVSPTVGVTLSDINSLPLAAGVELGAKATKNGFSITLGGGSVKTPDWSVGTMNYGVVSANYAIPQTPGLSVGVGTFWRNNIGYRPFAQLTGEVAKNYDVTLRLANGKDDILSVGVARKF